MLYTCYNKDCTYIIYLINNNCSMFKCFTKCVRSSGCFVRFMIVLFYISTPTIIISLVSHIWLLKSIYLKKWNTFYLIHENKIYYIILNTYFIFYVNVFLGSRHYFITVESYLFTESRILIKYLLRNLHLYSVLNSLL